MMPLTAAACFNNVCRELVGTTMEFGEFFVISDDLAMSLQAWTKEIGHQDNIGDLTNRTFRFGLLANSASGPHQFWVRITDFFSTQTASVIFVDQVAARHTVVN